MQSTGLEQTTVLIALAVFYLTLINEIRRHRYNSKGLDFIGATANNVITYRIYYIIYASLPVCLFLASKYVGDSVDESRVQIALGLALLFLAQRVRNHAISLLGRGWTMDLRWISDWVPVRDGIFRFFRHPEYLSRFVDALGIGLMVGLPPVSISVLALFAAGSCYLALLEAKVLRKEVTGKAL